MGNSVREWLLNMNISTRLGLGFGALVFLIIAFGLSALYQMDRLKKQGENLYLHPFTVTSSVDEVELATLKIHRSMKDIAHIINRDKIQSHESQIAAYEEEALQHLEIVSSRFLGDQQLVKKVHQSLIDWRPIRDEVIQLRLAGDFLGAGHTRFDQVQLECSQIFGRSQFGGAAKEAGEPQNRAQVGGLCLWVELAHRHVFDHALTQRAGRMLNGHGSVSCVVG
jgi:hypothetical protein